MLAGDEIHVVSALRDRARPRRDLHRLVAARPAEGRGSRLGRRVPSRRWPSRPARLLGAVPRRTAAAPSASGRRTRAPVAVAVGSRSSRPATASGRATRALRRATTTASSLDGAARGPIRARAGSRRACAGRRASSTRARFEIAAGPELELDELVLYELHVGTFTREGTFDGVDPAARARLARARRDGDRADAGRDLPRRARLGLRRPLHARRRTRPTAGRRARAARRRGPPRGPRRRARRRLQPHRPGRRGAARLRPVLHRPPRDPVGRRARLRASAGVREWAIQNAELWVRDYRHRRAPARRRRTPSTTTRRRTSSPSWPSASARSTRTRS